MTNVFARQPDPSQDKPSWQIVEVFGRWPEELTGNLLRNGPALFQRGSIRKSHLFDGDGFAQCWKFSEGAISHHGAWIKTNKFKQEQNKKTFIYPGFSSPSDPKSGIHLPDEYNPANTNLIAFNGELLALWEGGSAYTLNQSDLSTIGTKGWSTETTGAPFGAHPKRDREGNLWNIGISDNKLLVYKINSEGKLQQIRVHTVRSTALVHDFLLTDNYLCILLAPLELNRQSLVSGSSILEAMSWHEEKGSQLILINRDSLDVERTIELSPEIVFHFANGWQSNNELFMQYIKSNLYALRDPLNMSSNPKDGVASLQSELKSLKINLSSGKITEEHGPKQTEFPQIDQRFSGQETKACFGLISSCTQPTTSYDGLFRHSTQKSQCDHWFAEPGVELEEHVHVPVDSQGEEGSGWLVGTGYDNNREQSFCSVFNSERINEGPLAIAYLDRPAPTCVHGQFVKTNP